MNPKDQAAQSKPGLTNVPLAPLYEVSAALVEGAIKYGPWNWRAIKVDVTVYVAAAMRHLSQYQAGEDIDPDSGISHITKAIAGLVILRDAMIHDCVNDDRGPAQDLNLAGLQAAIQELKAKHAGPDKLQEDADPPRPVPVAAPLQLEAGKTYINGNGCFIRVRKNVSDLYPFTDGDFSYTAEGVFDLNEEGHYLNLITELPEDTEVESSTPLQLEAGKTYVSRCGVRVEVVAHDSLDYPFSGPSHTYTPEGRVYEEADCGWDLVREV